MKKENTKGKGGGVILKGILIIAAILALKYFLHFDLIAWLKSPQGQNIIQPIWTGIKNFYFWLDGLFRSHANK